MFNTKILSLVILIIIFSFGFGADETSNNDYVELLDWDKEETIKIKTSPFWYNFGIKSNNIVLHSESTNENIYNIFCDETHMINREDVDNVKTKWTIQIEPTRYNLINLIRRTGLHCDVIGEKHVFSFRLQDGPINIVPYDESTSPSFFIEYHMWVQIFILFGAAVLPFLSSLIICVCCKKPRKN